jgi:hypothetical protein
LRLPPRPLRSRAGVAERGLRLGEGRHRSDADVIALEHVEPLFQRAAAENLGELGGERRLVGVVLAVGELRPADALSQP